MDEELVPYQTADGKVVVEGPSVSVQPAAAQSLALAIHELATNAAKYGALSTGQGNLQVSWELTFDLLVLSWTEVGGPSTQTPTSPGLGTRIIRASIEGQLGGAVVFDWREAGLQCVLAVPRGNVIAAVLGVLSA